MDPSTSVASKQAAGPSAASGVVAGAGFALAVLFSMNLLNYVDRYVFAAVGLAIRRELSLSDSQFGFLSSAFIIAYTLFAPVVGWVSDRWDRRKLMSMGVAVWGCATVAAAFATNFNQMLWARALLGIGEASYGVVAPGLLADFFMPEKRGKMMGVFYLGMPLGTAAGYALGGLMEAIGNNYPQQILAAVGSIGLGSIGSHFLGWRLAFWVVGLPGLLVAVLGLLMREPRPRLHAARPQAPDRLHANPTWRDYGHLLRTPSYLWNTAGMAAVTFTTGAIGIWIPTYFELVHNVHAERKYILGLALATGGLLGVLIGMWLPDRLRHLTPRAYMLWAGLAVLAAVPLGIFGLIAGRMEVSLGLLTLASICMSSCLGPCNTVTANVIPSARRGMGYALSIFLMHLLGDIPSPYLVGALADWLAGPGRGSWQTRFFMSIGAGPVPDGQASSFITAGMLVIVPVLVVGGFCFLIGSCYLPRDQARTREVDPSPGEPVFVH